MMVHQPVPLPTASIRVKADVPMAAWVAATVWLYVILMPSTWIRYTELPVVVDEKCTACGACVDACPRDIIELRKKNKKDRKIFVSCINEKKGLLRKRIAAWPVSVVPNASRFVPMKPLPWITTWHLSIPTNANSAANVCQSVPPMPSLNSISRHQGT